MTRLKGQRLQNPQISKSPGPYLSTHTGLYSIHQLLVKPELYQDCNNNVAYAHHRSNKFGAAQHKQKYPPSLLLTGICKSSHMHVNKLIHKFSGRLDSGS